MLFLVGGVRDIDKLVGELDYNVGSFPSTYLGLPFRVRYKAVFVWEGIEEKFRRKLAIWKSQHISKGGRLTLIESTLSNIPIYMLFLFRLPKDV